MAGSSAYRQPGKAESAIYGASVCNCLALVFFICVIFSPFTVWSVNSAVGNRFGSGPFVPSASRSNWICADDGSADWCVETFIQAQWNTWGEIRDSQAACSNQTNIYRDWSSRYGFCDKLDGEFNIIPEIKTIQAFNIIGFVFLFFAALSGCSVVATRKNGVITAAVLTFVAMISTLISFSLMVSTQWYKDLRSSEGSFIPIFSGGKLVAMPAASWGFGPAFGLVIVVWIWTLFGFCCYLYLGKMIDAELDEAFAEDKLDEELARGSGPVTGSDVVVES